MKGKERKRGEGGGRMSRCAESLSQKRAHSVTFNYIYLPEMTRPSPPFLSRGYSRRPSPESTSTLNYSDTRASPLLFLYREFFFFSFFHSLHTRVNVTFESRALFYIEIPRRNHVAYQVTVDVIFYPRSAQNLNFRNIRESPSSGILTYFKPPNV